MASTGIRASGSFGKESEIFKITREVERFVRTASRRIGVLPAVSPIDRFAVAYATTLVSLAATVERLKLADCGRSLASAPTHCRRSAVAGSMAGSGVAGSPFRLKRANMACIRTVVSGRNPHMNLRQMRGRCREPFQNRQFFVPTGDVIASVLPAGNELR